MNDVLEAPVMSNIDRFYSKKLYLSYSALKRLLFSPREYYQLYINKLWPEKTEAHLIEGSLVHCLLLNQEDFHDNFLVSSLNVPNADTVKVIKQVYKQYTEKKDEFEKTVSLKDFKDEILKALVAEDYHQSLADQIKKGKKGKKGKNGEPDEADEADEIIKTGDSKRLDKMLTPENIEYFEFLKIKGEGKKDIIDTTQLQECEIATAYIRQNESIMDLLGYYVTEIDNVDVYNELLLTADIEGYPFGLKGILDNFKVNHDEKKIYINDIKKTARQLSEFRKTIDTFNYDLQCIMYYILVSIKFRKLIDKGYTIEFRFVVIDKNLQIYPFPVTEPTIKIWTTNFYAALDKAAYHYDNRSYNLPHDFERGLVTL